MPLTIEQVATTVQEAIPDATVEWPPESCVVLSLGLEKFIFTELEEREDPTRPSGWSSQGGVIRWTGKVALNTVSAEADYGSERVEDEGDLAVWLADVCDRMEQDAVKALVKMLRFPDALDTSLHTLKGVLYHLHIAKALDSTGRIIAATCAALPTWAGWQTGKGSARRLASSDGLSTGGLAYKQTGITNTGDLIYEVGFKFRLHSFSTLTRTTSLRDKVVETPSAGNPEMHLMNRSRELFVTHLVTHLTTLSGTPALWGPPQRG